jgi:hypothetical protein
VPAHGFEPPDRQLQADGEEQEDDAEFGKQLGLRTLL